MKSGSGISALAWVGMIVGSLVAGAASAQDAGAIVGWGYEVVVLDAELTDLVAIAGGGVHSPGLKANGSIVAWGDNHSGECSVPAPNSGFVAVAAGFEHTLGLSSPL
jgi:hypothetical protein